MRKIKKRQKTYNAKNVEYGTSIKKAVIILGSIILALVIIYLLVAIFITKEIDFSKKTTEDVPVESTIQYSEILAGETFSKGNDEYYVLFTDSTGNYYSIYNNIISSSSKKIYIVDLSNPLNKSYISDETNSSAQKASDLKVKDNTLIKIVNGKNEQYIENSSDIISNLK